MTNRSTILNELESLGSTLSNDTPQSCYNVPNGYFEGLADQILNRIKALEVADSSEEIKVLSTVLSQVSNSNVYSVPAGYFESLADKLMQGIREHSDYQTSKEELTSISPLLSGISKKSPYTVPEGYFENLGNKTKEKSETKVISIASRKWYRYAAAAVIVGIITMGGWLFISKKQIDPVKNPDGWVAKNTKKISTDEVNSVINLDNNAHLLNNSSVASNDANAQEIKDLMKDVSEKEIDNFLNDADKLEDNDEATLLN